MIRALIVKLAQAILAAAVIGAPLFSYFLWVMKP